MPTPIFLPLEGHVRRPDDESQLPTTGTSAGEPEERGASGWR